MNRLIVLTGLVVLLALCSGAAATPTLSVSDTDLRVGESSSFTSNGTVTSLDQSVAEIQSGQIEAIGAGTTTIRATDQTGFRTVQVNVSRAYADRIEVVTPDPLVIGERFRPDVILHLQNGGQRDITSAASLSWSSNLQRTATTGNFSATDTGTAFINATYDDFFSNYTVSVSRTERDVDNGSTFTYNLPVGQGISSQSITLYGNQTVSPLERFYGTDTTEFSLVTRRTLAASGGVTPTYGDQSLRGTNNDTVDVTSPYSLARDTFGNYGILNGTHPSNPGSSNIDAYDGGGDSYNADVDDLVSGDEWLVYANSSGVPIALNRTTGAETVLSPCGCGRSNVDGVLSPAAVEHDWGEFGPDHEIFAYVEGTNPNGQQVFVYNTDDWSINGSFTTGSFSTANDFGEYGGITITDDRSIYAVATYDDTNAFVAPQQVLSKYSYTSGSWSGQGITSLQNNIESVEISSNEQYVHASPVGSSRNVFYDNYSTSFSVSTVGVPNRDKTELESAAGTENAWIQSSGSYLQTFNESAGLIDEYRVPGSTIGGIARDPSPRGGTRIAWTNGSQTSHIYVDDLIFPGTRQDDSDDFDDGDMSEYKQIQNNGVTQTSVVESGSHAMEISGGNNNVGHPVSTSGLPHYPRAGDTFEFYVQNGQFNSYAELTFAAQSESERPKGYRLAWNNNNDNFELSRTDTQGSGGPVLDSASPNSNAGDWHRILVEWGLDGQINATIFPAGNMNQKYSLNATDTTYKTGGIAWTGPFNSNSGASVYFDSLRLLDRPDRSPYGTQPGDDVGISPVSVDSGDGQTINESLTRIPYDPESSLGVSHDGYLLLNEEEKTPLPNISAGSYPAETIDSLTTDHFDARLDYNLDEIVVWNMTSTIPPNATKVFANSSFFSGTNLRLEISFDNSTWSPLLRSSNYSIASKDELYLRATWNKESAKDTVSGAQTISYYYENETVVTEGVEVFVNGTKIYGVPGKISTSSSSSVTFTVNGTETFRIETQNDSEVSFTYDQIYDIQNVTTIQNNTVFSAVNKSLSHIYIDPKESSLPTNSSTSYRVFAVFNNSQTEDVTSQSTDFSQNTSVFRVINDGRIDTRSIDDVTTNLTSSFSYGGTTVVNNTAITIGPRDLTDSVGFLRGLIDVSFLLLLSLGNLSVIVAAVYPGDRCWHVGWGFFVFSTFFLTLFGLFGFVIPVLVMLVMGLHAWLDTGPSSSVDIDIGGGNGGTDIDDMTDDF